MRKEREQQENTIIKVNFCFWSDFGFFFILLLISGSWFLLTDTLIFLFVNKNE